MTGEYDTVWLSRAGLPPGQRLRFGLTTERGVPVAFLVQLEYWFAGEWFDVARFDHDRDSDERHDVSTSGLHLDVLRPDGTKLQTPRGFPPVPIRDAVKYAERYFTHHHETLVSDFRRML